VGGVYRFKTIKGRRKKEEGRRKKEEGILVTRLWLVRPIAI